MKVAVVSPSLEQYSETFIRTHIDHLPFEVRTVSGSRLDMVDGDSLLRETRAERLSHYPARKLGRFDEDRFAATRQARWLSVERIDVVLAEYGFTATRFLPACRLAAVPLVAHFHGYDAHNREAIAAHGGGYGCLFREAAAVVGVSRTMGERLVALGAAPERLHHIPYWVAPDEFEFRPSGTSVPSVLAVGRFVEKKAPHLTLLAFAKVLEALPEARLEMAGEGALLGPCRWLARSLGIEQAVTFLGSKNHDWVKKAMQRSRAFVQHSVEATNGDSEGTPVAVLEAQCSGLPVVATRHTGIADVVVDGETGFLCDEGDVETMAGNMVRVLTMEEGDFQHMATAARQRILDHFGKAETLDKLAALLRTAAK